MDIFTKEKRSEIMKKIKSKDTGPEKKVRSLLHSLGYRFRLYRKDLPGKPDIVLPKYKTVIFVHGCFWHGHNCTKGTHIPVDNAEFWKEKIKKNKNRDVLNLQMLKEIGWNVIIIWECQIKVLNKEKILAALQGACSAYE